MEQEQEKSKQEDNTNTEEAEIINPPVSGTTTTGPGSDDQPPHPK